MALGRVHVTCRACRAEYREPIAVVLRAEGTALCPSCGARTPVNREGFLGLAAIAEGYRRGQAEGRRVYLEETRPVFGRQTRVLKRQYRGEWGIEP